MEGTYYFWSRTAALSYRLKGVLLQKLLSLIIMSIQCNPSVLDLCCLGSFGSRCKEMHCLLQILKGHLCLLLHFYIEYFNLKLSLDSFICKW